MVVIRRFRRTMTPRQTMSELNTSAKDSMASATSACEWPAMPAASFTPDNTVFVAIPRKVARRLRWRRVRGTMLFVIDD